MSRHRRDRPSVPSVPGLFPPEHLACRKPELSPHRGDSCSCRAGHASSDSVIVVRCSNPRCHDARVRRCSSQYHEDVNNSFMLTARLLERLSKTLGVQNSRRGLLNCLFFRVHSSSPANPDNRSLQMPEISGVRNSRPFDSAAQFLVML